MSDDGLLHIERRAYVSLRGTSTAFILALGLLDDIRRHLYPVSATLFDQIRQTHLALDNGPGISESGCAERRLQLSDLGPGLRQLAPPPLPPPSFLRQLLCCCVDQIRVVVTRRCGVCVRGSWCRSGRRCTRRVGRDSRRSRKLYVMRRKKRRERNPEMFFIRHRRQRWGRNLRLRGLRHLRICRFAPWQDDRAPSTVTDLDNVVV